MNVRPEIARTAMSPSGTIQRKDIQGLRAIAVLAVLFHHLELPYFEGGYVGVDVFFVISGYLISKSIIADLRHDRFSFVDFYVRRIRRLYPALLATIAASLVFGFLLLSPEHFEEAAKAAGFSVLWISNFLFYWQTGYFDSDSLFKPLLHTWSLSVEEQFYLLWPLLLVALSLLPFRRTMMAAVLLLIPLGVVGSQMRLEADSSAAFFLLPARIFEFAMGAALLWVNRMPTRPSLLYDALVAIGLALIAYAILSFSPNTPFPGYHALVPCLGAALVIFAGERSPTASTLIQNAPAVWIGGISYSLYLVHWPLIVYYRYWTFGEISFAEKILLAVASTLFAWAMYRFIETLLRRPTPLVPNRRFGVGVTVVTSVVAVASTSVVAGEGFKWRLPQDLEFRPKGTRAITLSCNEIDWIDGVSACKMGNEGEEPDLVLVGDSHAQVLADAVPVALSDDTSALLLQSPGIVPFLNVRSINGTEAADANFDATLHRVAQSSASVVVIHARFALHWHTTRPMNESGQVKLVGDNNGGIPLNVYSSQQNFLTGLVDTVNLLKGAGKEVAIIGAVPHLGVDLPTCFSRPSYLLSVKEMSVGCGGYTLTEATARAGDVNKILRQFSSKLGYIFVDPVPVFCPDDTANYCERSNGSKLYYRDDDHLSRYGADMLLRYALAKIRRTSPTLFK